MEFQCVYWSETVKMDLLARWILIHSFLYYELNYNIVEDHKYDANSKQLVNMIEADPKSWKRSKFYYAMKDFDGSTGFGFYQLLNPEHFNIVSRDAVMLKDKY